ncbi:aminotransferase class V-fold PLP-dependent enzyme [Gloeobacter kilaueensis]|uniref:Cysteine desulfurase n=1 Tax=Gloeobacter kilaueensis (strain ATCC BAA-2537 / CCAP 1431/1 / ULC 316 / JS1) TaxID=1183438 RepID=U5QC90_GLOK1|nr:aminotransferase class V-fold PLP-dependent enzyme [Gloeobacter kilaueensis]AGY56476.1 cysteine desulfurase [Gloeobacter kilaueensis JS1]
MNRIDVERARRETPGCANVLHFNNAGAALLPEPVLWAVSAHQQREAAIGGYEAADESREAIEHTYGAVAGLIGCSSEEVAIVENATRAWDMAFYALRFAPGERILTGVSEYASNYIALLQVARRTGAVIEVIPNDADGQIAIAALERAIDERTRLIALTHVPTNGGLVNPAAAVGAVARKAGVLYLLDACQSVGQLPIDVEHIGCDLLSATGRKYLRAPRGTGFLYVRAGLCATLEPPFLDLRAARWTSADTYTVRPDARRFESWESNAALKIGLGVAADYAASWGIEAIAERIGALAARLRNGLGAIRRVEVMDLGRRRCGIVSFQVAGIAAETIKRRLRAQGINASVSDSHSTLLDSEARGLGNLVRASVHYYNTEAEVERFCEALSDLIDADYGPAD